jgi:hypothetical protein
MGHSCCHDRGSAARSPWIKFLRDNKFLKKFSALLREAGEKYRAAYGVKPQYRSAAMKRKIKLRELLLLFRMKDYKDYYN